MSQLDRLTLGRMAKELGFVTDTPVLITIILWIVCGVGLSVWFDNVGF